MNVCCANQCAYCRSSIVSGQRWVREKICDRALWPDASYHDYHAELFAGQEAAGKSTKWTGKMPGPASARLSGDSAQCRKTFGICT
jgi:hypothetical protein